jgi:hypothetical protein
MTQYITADDIIIVGFSVIVRTFEIVFIFHSMSRFPTNPTISPSRCQYQSHSTLDVCVLSVSLCIFQGYDDFNTLQEIKMTELSFVLVFVPRHNSPRTAQTNLLTNLGYLSIPTSPSPALARSTPVGTSTAHGCTTSIAARMLVAGDRPRG